VKAIVYEETGPSSMLKLQDKPLADPGAGEVRVRVVVSGVNPTDWKSRAGGGGSTTLEAPKVPNQDGAGVIDGIGSGVKGLSIGERVSGTSPGAAMRARHRSMRLYRRPKPSRFRVLNPSTPAHPSASPP
jgi:NADPH:quinone reductase-like Zn-dependent oxidoreductase